MTQQPPVEDEPGSLDEGSLDEVWGWAHETDDTPAAQVSTEQVTAVLVAHNADEWLSRTLRALAELDARPARLIAVDAASSDATRARLDEALADGVVDRVVEGPSTGFGAAVNAALTQDAAPGAPTEPGWLWLLHDDLEPTPTALQALLRSAAADPAPALLFPTLLGPRRRNHPDQLLEVGQSLAPSGRRVLSVEPGDIHQSQQDARATLGGSTAGLLITRDAWQQLGGLDADLPLFRDGVDLGWRANDAGLVVRTVPDATLRHHQRGRWGDRRSTLSDDLPTLDRLLGMRLVAAHSPRPTATRVWLWLRSLLSALVLLIGKNPDDASAAWRAGWQVLRDGAATQRLRQRLTSATGQQSLRPDRWERVTGVLGSAASALGERDTTDQRSDTSLDDLIGDDFSGGRTRARLLAPTTAVLLGLAVLCLVAGRRLFGAGQLTAPHLLPAPSSAAEVFQAWLHPAAGHAGPNAPWLGLAAVGSWLSLGTPELLIRAVLIGAPLLAALAFLHLVRVVLGRGADGWLAGLLSAAWGLTVAALGVAGRGDVTAVAVAVLAPLAAAAWLRWWRQDRRDGTGEVAAGETWRAPGLVALWLGLLGTAQPLFWLVAVLTAVLHAVLAKRFSARTVVVALAPLLLSAPWLLRLARNPGRLLTAADPTGATGGVPRPLALAAGRLGAGVPPPAVALVLFGLLWVGAALVAVALLRRRSAREAWTPILLLAVALAAVSVGGWLSRLLVTIDGQPTRPAADSWVVLAMLGLLGCWLWWVATSQAGRARHLVTVGLAVLVLAAAVGWQWSVPSSPLRVGQPIAPAHVLGVQDSPRASRALVVVVNAPSATSPGGVSWNLTNATSPQWGSGELNPAGGGPDWARVAEALVDEVVTATPADDLATRLAELGISYVIVSNGGAEQLNALTNTQGLVAAPSDSRTMVFTVVGLAGRAWVVSGAGASPAPLPDGVVAAGSTGSVVIAETWDPRWRVTVGGQPVSVEPGDRETPPSGLVAPLAGQSGEVRWYTQPSHWAAIWETSVLVLLLILAAPTLGRQRLTGDGARFGEDVTR